MSTAAVAEPLAPPSVNGEALSPVDYVRSLSPEDKEKVLVSLLKELIEIYDGAAFIPIDPAGEPMGYYVPPAAAKEQCERTLAGLSPEAREQVQKTLAPDFDWEDCLTDDDVQAILRGEESTQSK